IARAQGHFLETIKALELTEGWPEGYNYWINSRAFLIALAGSAYLNGLDRPLQADRVRRALRRVGYWTLYATRPDHRIEALGDEGPRVDLKDETRRVIDLIAQLTRDPVFAAYSAALGQLHGAESYYRDYRWGFRLFNDPSLAPTPGASLAGLLGGLPSAELFGRNALNLAYIRSGWTPDATFISFRAGDSFTHHGHYDAGHFSLFKGAPLAINSSAYGGFFSPNRLNYTIRSIAKNTLLILRPGEKVQPNHFFADNVADGGQRITLPTGSVISSVRDWLDHRGKGLHLEGGQVERFEHREGDYAYIAADLTAAYNTPAHDEGGWGGKVERVERQLLYLPGEDRLLVRDRVRAVKADFVKKWLLHTVGPPQVEGLRALKGDPGNGILESDSDMALVQNGRGWLAVQRILPQDAVIRRVGGRDYQYYVEADGDDAQLDGVNFNQGASAQPWFDIGMWRLEIQPGAPRQEDTFLMVLTPALDAPRQAKAAPLSLQGRSGSGVLTEASAAVFLDEPAGGELRLTLPAATQTIRVIGLPPLARVELRSESGATPPAEQTASNGGVAVFNSLMRRGRLVLRWP
ncbi:MAG: heparinase II/III family protein, partial [Candidatus Competibacter sp.]|nr:heparinase II/III family protein [Candidatus Competibacter sp.]